MNDGHSGRTYLASRHVTVHIASSGWRDRGKITKDFGKVSASHLSRKKQTEWDQAMAEHAREELRGAPLTLFSAPCFCHRLVGLSSANRRLIDEAAHLLQIGADERGDWIDIDLPMDNEVEISAEGSEQDLLLEFTKR